MFQKIDKKYLLYGGVAFGIIGLFLLVLLIMLIFTGGKISYESLENKIRQASIKYYEKHDNELPISDGATVSVSLQKLVSSNNLKKLDKILDKGVSCKGEVTVTKNRNNYIYLPYLDCGKDYKTIKLTDKIINRDKVNEVGEGLYKIDDFYAFKGENVNNYLDFANKLWRIMRINEDGTIRIIANESLEQISWDNRYNVDKEYDSGINNYPFSRIKDKMKEIYNNDENFNKYQRSHIVTQNLCVGHRVLDSTINDGSLECANNFDEQSLGLIQLNEYMLPSLDENCKKPIDRSCNNYNYLASFNRAYWTLTGDADTTYLVYYIDGYADLKLASNNAGINVVLNLNKNLIYESGNGTLEKPYKYVQYKK
ncbi:MAG: hypothetical protein RSB72_01165 [Bacilli bacterium]